MDLNQDATFARDHAQMSFFGCVRFLAQLLICFFVLTAFSYGAAPSPDPHPFKVGDSGKNYLIVIGYTDERGWENFHSPLDLFVYDYHFATARVLDLRIRENLFISGFEESNVDPDLFFDKSSKTSVRVLNTNVYCPAEVEAEARGSAITKRFRLCLEQIQRLNAVRAHMKTALTSYHEFFYIGHARRGRGLALGPYLPEFVFNPVFYNKKESGSLQKVVIAACDSEKYFRKKIVQHTGIEFKGYRGNLDLLEDLLPKLEEELGRALRP